jgi:hypothetical protein
MLALAILADELQQELSAGEKLTFIDLRPTALSKQNHIPWCPEFPARFSRVLLGNTGAARPASGGNEFIKIVTAVDGSLSAFDSKNGLRLVAGQGALLALGR